MDESLNSVSVGEIWNSKKKATIQISKVADEFYNQLKSKTINNYNKIIPLVKQIILNAYKSIARNNFDIVYGKYYHNEKDNKDNIFSGISFYISDDLLPNMSYISRDFYTSKDIKQSRHSFNSNYRDEINYDDFLGLDELDAIEQLEFENAGMDDIEDFSDYLQEEEYNELKDRRVFRKRKVLRTPNEIYTEAKAQTDIDFAAQFKYTILPYIKNKIKISL